MFAEREGFYDSADAGVSFHYNFPSNYGDVHVGVYNGEGYAKTEVNDQKAFEIRGTVRPFATSAPVLRGLRVHRLLRRRQLRQERRADARGRAA